MGFRFTYLTHTLGHLIEFSLIQSLHSSRVETILVQDAKLCSDYDAIGGRTGDVKRQAGNPDLFKQILNKR